MDRYLFNYMEYDDYDSDDYDTLMDSYLLDESDLETFDDATRQE